MTDETREASHLDTEGQAPPYYSATLDYLLGRKLSQFAYALRTRISSLRKEGVTQRAADVLERLLDQLAQLTEGYEVSVDFGSGMFRMTRCAARILGWLDSEIARYRSAGKDSADTLDLERGRLLRAIREVLGPHADALFQYASELAIDSSPPTPESARRLDNRPLRGPIAPMIEKAIEQEGSDEFQIVYGALRKMALDSQPPFTSQINQNSGALRYTDDDNKMRWFTKNALSCRLSRRRKAS